MGKFDDFFKKRQKDSDANYEFYEDSHNEYGEYLGQRQSGATVKSEPAFSYTPLPKDEGQRLPGSEAQVSARNYQNVVVYEPRTPDDVQMLIDYLKRREPAIINLDSISEDDAQRILDFVSGAIYALNGSIHRVASNIFLLSPEGVEITVPYVPSN